MPAVAAVSAAAAGRPSNRKTASLPGSGASRIGCGKASPADSLGSEYRPPDFYDSWKPGGFAFSAHTIPRDSSTILFSALSPSSVVIFFHDRVLKRFAPGTLMNAIDGITVKRALLTCIRTQELQGWWVKNGIYFNPKLHTFSR